MKDIHLFLSDKKCNLYTVLIILLLSITLAKCAINNATKITAHNQIECVLLETVEFMEVSPTNYTIIKTSRGDFYTCRHKITGTKFQVTDSAIVCYDCTIVEYDRKPYSYGKEN
jgi:PhoPQ-activated pathogenicity-related protein